MTNTHARLSPSGAHRWMACPGSAVLEAGLPDNGSVFADEGTAAHTLAAWCLEDKTNAADYIGEVINVGERKFTVDKSMAGYVQDYVNFVRELAEGKSLLVERRVPIGHLTGEDGAKGTSDAVIIDGSGRNLSIVDLKYGMGVEVSAIGNEQAQMYALGTYEEYGMLADFDTVSMYIHMPRLNYVSEYHITVGELLQFADKVRAAAAKVEDAAQFDVAVRIEGWADAEPGEFDREYLRPGEKQCKFCKAKATCPALRAEVFSQLVGEVATAEDFAQFVPEPVTADDGDNFLAIAMSKAGLIEDWIKSVRAEVERRLLAGKPVPGYKLVEGKKGNRKWRDEATVEEVLKSMRLKQDEMYDRKLISPTSAEKLLKKQSPQRWAKLQEHIDRADGKPSVAPATDPRPELAITTATADEFAALATTE